MSETRVPADELEETDPHGEGLWMMTWRGAPFTGVAFSVHGNGAIATETPFVDGNAHGRCTVHGPDGQLTRVFEMRHGMFVGEDRAWFPSGALRHERIRGATHRDYRERIWNEAGVLVSERDDARRLSRRWEHDGTLRSEREGDVTRFFSRAGRLLYTIDHGTARYEDDAIEACLTELLDAPEDRRVALGYLLRLFTRDRARAIEHLRGALGRLSGYALVQVVDLAAQLGATELRPSLEALVHHESVPPLERVGTGQQGTTLTLGAVARRALAKLR